MFELQLEVHDGTKCFLILSTKYNYEPFFSYTWESLVLRLTRCLEEFVRKTVEAMQYIESSVWRNSLLTVPTYHKFFIVGLLLFEVSPAYIHKVICVSKYHRTESWMLYYHLVSVFISPNIPMMMMMNLTKKRNLDALV